MDLFNDAMKYADKSRGKVENSTKYNNDQSLTFTPVWVVNEMLDMLPDQVWNKHTTFLDISCKTGVFLVEIFKRLDKILKDIPEFEDDKVRREHILNKQLYGLTLDDNLSLMMSRRNLTGNAFSGNIKYIRQFDKKQCNQKEYMNDAIINNRLKEEFDKLEFDIVVGNPPYSKGADLDFIRGGYIHCKQYVCMIVPAKWQTAEANQRVVSKMTYGEFREKLVPHMKAVTFYPDCKDIFDIGQRDGVTEILVDKNNTYVESKITNKSKLQPWYNGTEIRNIQNRQSLINIGDEIVRHLGDYKRFKFGYKDYEHKVWTNTQCPVGGGVKACNTGYAFSRDGKAQYISLSSIDLRQSGTCEVQYSSNSLEECESFKSWLETKFTRFFVAINISKLGPILTDDYFRFVPAPPSGKFDHIYTDEELYDAFNLPQKYRDVIEAVVAERK